MRLEGSVPEFGISLIRDVMMPMRDDVQLATDIYRPTSNGTPLAGGLPTILGRTSYGKETDFLWRRPVIDYFTPRGYAVVVQDMRGRGNSQGIGEYFHTATPKDGDDGYDTVEWIAAQDWSNGRIGTTGSSHGGMVQIAMALKRPPHLSAMWIDVAPTNNYAHQAREGGAMQMMMFSALFMHAHDAPEVRDDVAKTSTVHRGMEQMREWLRQTPWKPGRTPLSVSATLEQTLFDYYWRGEYDDYWASEFNNYEAFFANQIDIPTVYSGGWWDPYAVATTNHFAVMSRQNKTPQKLLMGPWIHGGMREEATFAGDVDFGHESRWGMDHYSQMRLRWFDRWLKDVPNGVEDEPPVRIFVMGGGGGGKTRDGHVNHGGHWRAEAEWPLSRARERSLYLTTEGLLSEAPSGLGGTLTYSHDPSNPVPTVASAVSGFYEMWPLPAGIDPTLGRLIPPRARMRSIVMSGSADQREHPEIVGASPPYLELGSRPDVLVFETDSLLEPVEVTGASEVVLWISSSAVDTDFTAKLIDVYPPDADYPSGYSMNVVESIIRTRYRQGWDTPHFLDIGEVAEVHIRLPPTSNLFAAGHRIRLDIASSNFPRFDVNPNTGESVGRHTHQVVAINSVHLGEPHPSRLILSIVGQT
jgi:hypothetical protein